jgi:flagellar protein FlaG
MQPQGPQAPSVQVTCSDDYRDNYANSVQVRVSLWDFFLMFGTVQQPTPEAVTVRQFQGIYLSPQQAKALANLLQQNLQQYEATFGEISLQQQSDESRILQ